mmetsp:Transcript_21626/g.74272  ORF Transcript_21626/g.74272 Transcript_21626/m.74272 type:complete len:251 (-) Transcript_21626:700-1452(-)
MSWNLWLWIVCCLLRATDRGPAGQDGGRVTTAGATSPSSLHRGNCNVALGRADSTASGREPRGVAFLQFHRRGRHRLCPSCGGVGPSGVGGCRRSGRAATSRLLHLPLPVAFCAASRFRGLPAIPGRLLEKLREGPSSLLCGEQVMLKVGVVVCRTLRGCCAQVAIPWGRLVVRQALGPKRSQGKGNLMRALGACPWQVQQRRHYHGWDRRSPLCNKPRHGIARRRCGSAGCRRGSGDGSFQCKGQLRAT